MQRALCTGARPRPKRLIARCDRTPIGQDCRTRRANHRIYDRDRLHRSLRCRRQRRSHGVDRERRRVLLDLVPRAAGQRRVVAMVFRTWIAGGLPAEPDGTGVLPRATWPLPGIDRLLTALGPVYGGSTSPCVSGASGMMKRPMTKTTAVSATGKPNVCVCRTAAPSMKLTPAPTKRPNDVQNANAVARTRVSNCSGKQRLKSEKFPPKKPSTNSHAINGASPLGR